MISSAVSLEYCRLNASDRESPATLDDIGTVCDRAHRDQSLEHVHWGKGISTQGFL